MRQLGLPIPQWANNDNRYPREFVVLSGAIEKCVLFMGEDAANRSQQMAVAAVAAFGTYFCMYAFRKPFTAATYEGQQFVGLELKTVLVISQLAGYMTAKFVGIKIVSEMRSERRAAAIIGLILLAQAALVGFAYVPVPWKVVMLFLNGLPLGVIFGLVLAYLEGRRQTEALSAALCASFIISSGVVKSVGRWLLHEWGMDEFEMPMVAGLIFLPLLILSVLVLRKTPAPDAQDRRMRTERKAMNRAERRQFFAAYWPGLSLLVFVYVGLTVIRAIRDDFGVELWRDMQHDQVPSVYAVSETIVALCVTLLNALTIWITHNLAAMRLTVGFMCASFGVAAVAVLLQINGWASPFVFMTLCGIGLYVPYVAFHTSLFERLIAASRHPSNLGFLMYLADAVGYLGYAVVLTLRTTIQSPRAVLPFFHTALIIVALSSIVALIAAQLFIQNVLARESRASLDLDSPQAVE